MQSVVNVLQPRCMSLRRCFGHYCVQSAKHIHSVGFIRMFREAGLVQGCSAASQAAGGASKLIEQNALDLLF